MLTLSLLGCAMTAAVPGEAPAADEPQGKRIVGWVEKILVNPGEHPVYAKLDSGARTSSIHAESIKRFRRAGERWVRFELVLKIRDEGEDHVERVAHEAPLYRKVRIKDHDEPPNSRPVVELDFCLGGRAHRAQFSLADRSEFIYPVLLGRRFLAGQYVIDPEKTFQSTASCVGTTARQKSQQQGGQEVEAKSGRNHGYAGAL